MSRIFITGVAGFLGSHLADAMLADGHEVVGIDNMIGGELDNVPSGVEFHQIDCNDFYGVKEKRRGEDIVDTRQATRKEDLHVYPPQVVTHKMVGESVPVISAAISNSVKR